MEHGTLFPGAGELVCFLTLTSTLSATASLRYLGGDKHLNQVIQAVTELDPSFATVPESGVDPTHIHLWYI